MSSSVSGSAIPTPMTLVIGAPGPQYTAAPLPTRRLNAPSVPLRRLTSRHLQAEACLGGFDPPRQLDRAGHPSTASAMIMRCTSDVPW